MKSRLVHWILGAWEGFWLLPGLMTMGAVTLGVTASGMGAGVPEWLWLSGSRFDGGAISGVLTTLAAGSITVGAVVFSITMLVLSSASAQFGPRLLSNFMRKTGAKVAIGGFVGSFSYQIVVAAALAQGEEVPDLAVWIGLVGGLGAFTILLAFLHMVSRFIRAPFIIDDVARDLDEALARACRRSDRRRSLSEGVDASDWGKVGELRAQGSGYLQAIEISRLREWAEENDMCLRVTKRPGSFICKGEPLVEMLGAGKLEEKAETLASAFVLDSHRTAQQDVEFALRQMVEIAAKAMSPGINDPYTAINVIDRLAGALTGISEAGPSPWLWYDEDGILRLAVPVSDAMDLLDAAYHPLREHVRRSPMVSISLMDTYAQLLNLRPHANVAGGIAKHAELLAEDFLKEGINSEDRATFEKRLEKLRAAAGESTSPR